MCQAGKDFSFVIHLNSFALCGIAMINKTNSQVWGSSIIPCLIKSTKDINQDNFGDVGYAYYVFIHQKNTYILLNSYELSDKEIDVRKYQRYVYT